MKRIALGILTATLFGALAIPASAANPRGTTTVRIKGATVSIEYGRPALNGKTIQQELARLPVGQCWRLGADRSTTFTTSADLHFGKTVVPKGVYSLFARKAANNKWSLVFNKQHGQWGINKKGLANLDPKLDIAIVPLRRSKATDSDERVTITLSHHGSGGKVTIQWGDLMLTTDFAVS
jgi:hypothetical protein